MADSDNSISLPSVIYPCDGRTPAIDSAVTLFSAWRGAKARSKTLSRLKTMVDLRDPDQSRPSSQVRDLWAPLDTEVDYASLCDGALISIRAEESLVDLLPMIEAASLDGAIAKLEMIVGAESLVEDPDAYPMPHIRSILKDLQRLKKAAHRAL